MSNQLLTISEVAQMLGVCRRTVDNLRASRAITFMKIGGSIRFTREAVDEFIAANTVPVAPTPSAGCQP